MIGNDSAGNPSTEATLDSQDMPFTTLNYMNGVGFAYYGDKSDGVYEPTDELEEGQDTPAIPRRIDISNIDTEAAGFHQEAFIPLIDETHSW